MSVAMCLERQSDIAETTHRLELRCRPSDTSLAPNSVELAGESVSESPSSPTWELRTTEELEKLDGRRSQENRPCKTAADVQMPLG